MAENIIQEVRLDLAAFKAVAAAGIMTEPVVNGLWRWFIDVELMLPLPIMNLQEEERTRYAVDILTEMDEAFDKLESRYPKMNDQEKSNLNLAPESVTANGLWRELAGVYAPIINRGVTVLDEDERNDAYTHVVETLVHTSGMDEDEIRDRIAHDPTLRLMLRRSGIDPDNIQ